MKPRSSILWALLVGASLAGGCGGLSEVHTDWESELAGSMNLSCHNIDHLGYGMHYDIIMSRQEATLPTPLLMRRYARPSDERRSP
jgi:hypothetical protein